MSGVLKHGFASSKANTSDATKVGSTKWNAEHAFAGGNLGALLFRDTGESDGANWLNSVASGQVLVSAGLGAAPAWSATPTLTSITLANTGLKVTDVGGSHVLSFVPGSTLTANRALTFVTGDAARTVTYSGNPTLDDWFDQSVKTTASPTFVTQTLTGGTVTASTPVVNAAQTWNNAAVTFTGWKLNVADTASAAASLLADWQIAGSSQASISKGGALVVNQGITLNNGGGGYQLRFGDPSSASLMAHIADGVLKFATHDASAGVALRFSTDQRLEVRNTANNAYGDIFGRALVAFSTGANVAGAGDFRMAHGGSLQARNNGNSANRQVLAFGATTTDTVELGDANVGTSFYGSTFKVGGAPGANTYFDIAGSLTATATGIGFHVGTTVTAAAGINAYHSAIEPRLVEAASGNHSLLAGLAVFIPTVTSGAATVTNTATFYVEGPATATVSGANYAMWSAAGVNRFDGGNDIRGNVTNGATGHVDFGADILPVTDANNNLGSSSKRWLQGSFSSYVAVGSTPATAGTIRLPSGAGSSLQVRNGANTNNLEWFSVDSSDRFFFGWGSSGASTTLQLGNTNAFLAVGGLTSSFPALKRNAAELEVKLGDDSDYANIVAASLRVKSGTYLVRAVTNAWTDHAGASTGTLTNSPAGGNPTKWIAIDDNGTTRYIPAW